MNPTRPQIAIFGIGALGMLFGSRLHDVADVTLVGSWVEQLATVAKAGLWVTELNGEQRHYKLRVTNELAPVQGMDIVLVLLKSHQTAAAAAKIRQALAPSGLTVTLQNGLGNREQLAAVLGSERVTAGVTAQGANVLAPGHIRHAGAGETHLAATASRGDLLCEFAALLNQGGIATTIVENAVGLIWGKVAVNAGLNPLTALFDIPNGAVLEDDLLCQAAMCAAREVAAVGAVQGIPLPYADAAERVVAVAQVTAANISSMLQDIRRGAPTEIEAICGAVVRAGEAWRISTPMNRLFVQLVHAQEEGQAPSQAFIRKQLHEIIHEGKAHERSSHHF